MTAIVSVDAPETKLFRSPVGPVPKRDRLMVGTVAAGVALLPLLRPSGPGHTAPEDVIMAAGVVVTLLWASATRARVHIPYLLPVGGLVLTGTLAAMFGISPSAGALAVGQDIFLLAWCAAVANACRTPAGLSVILRAWALSAVGWATILVGAVATHHRDLAGVHAATGQRTQFTFDNPNMAANYFFVSLFILVAARCPSNRLARAGAILMVLGAIVVTGSNAALLGLPLAGLMVTFVVIRRRADVVTAIAVVLLALLVGGAGLVFLKRQAANVHSSQNSLVRYSVARSSRSAAKRESLFASEFHLYLTGSLLGRGPNTTILTLGSSAAATVKTAHDDYLATLVERGPLGELALVFLIGAVTVRAVSIDPRRLSSGFARVIPETALLIGALAAMAVTAATHEVLHYRHLWPLLGIVAALYTFGRNEPPLGSEVPRGDRAVA
jgi:O-antigen ligase